jgi:hypothetical protein
MLINVRGRLWSGLNKSTCLLVRDKWKLKAGRWKHFWINLLKLSPTLFKVSYRCWSENLYSIMLSCTHCIQYERQYFICPVCYVRVSGLLWSNCSGKGGRDLSCGEMSGKHNFCVTCELNEHLFPHVTMWYWDKLDWYIKYMVWHIWSN